MNFCISIDLHLSFIFQKYIVADILSGLSVGIIHIPQGMGFALLAGKFPLFTTFILLIRYF